MVKLTEHFTLEEMTISQTAARRGLSNSPNPIQQANLTALCAIILEPLRAHFGRPVIVSSGFRSVKVNALIGGAADSQHTQGEAVDFTILGLSVKEVFDYLRASGLPYDQVIDEFGQWVHVSHKRNGKNRKQALKARHVNGKTIYTSA